MAMAESRYSFLYDHRGMLQADRQAQVPSPEAMQVSGRRFEDLVRRTAEFAREVIFYADDLHKENEAWMDFFRGIYDYTDKRVRMEVIREMERTSTVNPHLALLFAFYKMLLVAQEDINRLTGRQMEFYFREVLGFEMEKGTEGCVTVFAEPARNNPSVSIPKGHPFDAGKDADGNPVIYESVDELRLGREEVAFFARFDNQTGFEAVHGEVVDAQHALCVSSRLFNLSGRKVRVTIGNGDYLHGLIRNLKAEYTSADGWASAGDYDFSDGLTITDEMPPMVPYDPLVHGEGMTTDDPVIRLVSGDGLGVLSNISFSEAGQVSVALEDGEPLRLENKYGPVENRSGVNPFGYECRKDDWFQVVLPFPATGVDIHVEMNNMDVFDVAGNPPEEDGTSLDRKKYFIKDNDCDQEWISKNFSMRLLSIMRKETVEEDEIKEVMGGSLMAVSPRLTSPVTIRTALFSDDAAKVFLAHPCGVQQISETDDKEAGFGLGANDRIDGGAHASALYLAFSNADLERGQISLHVRVSNKVKDPGRVTWYSISGNGWEKFSESRILRDTTYGLSQDGTVVLDYQEKLLPGGNGLKEGFTWIKAVCDNGNCKEVTGVRSRAVELSYSPSSKGAGPCGAALPAETISKTIGSIPGLKKISQPFDGLAGKKAEAPAMFSRKVAEMLRHKGRAWTTWDYESLVLGEFPEVAYVKCLPSCDEHGDVSPGTVTIVIIPQEYEDPLMPGATVRLVNKVMEALKKVSSPFADIRIINPEYRSVRVKAKIALHKGCNDPVRYEALTSDAILDYLRPWKGYQGEQHFREGGGVSDIIAFLETLPFVDVVEEINVYVDGKEVGMDRSIELDKPFEVITSAPAHEVRCHTAN